METDSGCDKIILDTNVKTEFFAFHLSDDY